MTVSPLQEPGAAEAVALRQSYPSHRGRARLAGAGRLDGSIVGKIFIYFILLAGAVIFLVPLAYLIGGSFKTAPEVSNGSLNPLPRHAQPDNFPRALRQLDATQIDANQPLRFPLPLANTIVITAACVIGQIISSSLVGFGFARFRFRGRNSLFVLMLSTMMLPAQVTIIPVFLMFRSLGWIDTFWPLIVPAFLGSPFFVFMFRQFFLQIPEELVEAARIDGASNWTIYSRLMMPLCGPVIAIVAIYTFMGTWNDFLAPLIYLNSPENRTLAIALNNFKGQYGAINPQLLLAASTLTMLPCVILFFALQKYFVQSVAMTGIK